MCRYVYLYEESSGEDANGVVGDRLGGVADVVDGGDVGGGVDELHDFPACDESLSDGEVEGGVPLGSKKRSVAVGAVWSGDGSGEVVAVNVGGRLDCETANWMDGGERRDVGCVEAPESVGEKDGEDVKAVRAYWIGDSGCESVDEECLGGAEAEGSIGT